MLALSLYVVAGLSTLLAFSWYVAGHRKGPYDDYVLWLKFHGPWFVASAAMMLGLKMDFALRRYEGFLLLLGLLLLGLCLQLLLDMILRKVFLR